MTMKQAMTALVLTGIALFLSASAMAANLQENLQDNLQANLPAQAARSWAPTGDLIGLDNHVTIGGTIGDLYGNSSKYAEDWQQEDDVLFNGLFGFYTVLDNHRTILVRGFGESGRGTLASRVTLLTSRPAITASAERSSAMEHPSTRARPRLELGRRSSREATVLWGSGARCAATKKRRPVGVDQAALGWLPE